MKKNILILGGSRGIGAAIVKKFAIEGYNILFSYKTSESKATTLSKSLSNETNQVISYKLDIKNPNDIDNFYNYANKIFGHIDAVINVAGIDHYKLLIDEDFNSIKEIIDTNLTGTIYSCKNAVKHMLANGGKIINISSFYARYGAPYETVYSASKSALTSFTYALAKEVGSANILVNNIAPGSVKTDMIKEFLNDKKAVKEFFLNSAIKRPADPDEIAELALFLVSDKNTYITGQTIYIDGGM